MRNPILYFFILYKNLLHSKTQQFQFYIPYFSQLFHCLKQQQQQGNCLKGCWEAWQKTHFHHCLWFRKCGSLEGEGCMASLGKAGRVSSFFPQDALSNSTVRLWIQVAVWAEQDWSVNSSCNPLHSSYWPQHSVLIITSKQCSRKAPCRAHWSNQT